MVKQLSTARNTQRDSQSYIEMRRGRRKIEMTRGKKRESQNGKDKSSS